MQRLDVILVGAMAGVAQAAIYAAVSRFLSLGQMGAGAISQAVQPHLGEALASRDAYKTAHLYQTSTSWLVLVTWPLYLVLIIFAHPILKVFGGVYSQGNSVLIVLCLSMLVATSCGMVDMVLMMAGRTSWNLYNVLLAFAVNLGLDLWLIPRHGIFGAAVGWGVAILVANLVPLIQVAWSLGLHPFGPGTAAALSICVACFGFVPFGCKLLAGAGPVGLLTSLALGAACYLGGLYRFRGRLELASLRALRRSRRTRSA